MNQEFDLIHSGKVVKTFALGDQKISDSKNYLKSWVDRYTTALTDIHAHVGVNLTYPLVKETNEMVRGNPPRSLCPITDVAIAALNPQSQPQIATAKKLEERFLVPYQRNPHFTGRQKFLQTLRERLLAQVDKQYNHRIALYGMGGVGKTQCTLEYVYANEPEYERIYWLSGVDQAALLSGYQKIAKRVGLPKLQSPKETAEAVLSWLRREKKWLVVIDNLDDIKVADGLLPENAPENHTIITTRNPNTIGIPAEPLEVPVFGVDDAVELLLTLSRITVQPKSVEETEASNIVKTLGYLPLAIEQAASYIREVTGNLLTFSEEYSKNHRDILRRKPEDNRPYPFSIATTWAMALKVVQQDKTTTNFLRLLAYLNPDGILIDFLITGKDGLGKKLRQTISDRGKMATAIADLEKFSLVEWDRPNRLISIHRLVQRVIRDSMSTRDQRSTSYAVIDLCAQAFPNLVTENLAPWRLYQAQVVGPLVEMHSLHSENAANVKLRVGFFLREEGQYVDSEKLVLQGIEAFIKSTGKESRSTLGATSILTTIYFDQGRFSEALSLQKSLVTTQTKRFGTGDADTLYYMSNLAFILTSLGRSSEAVSLLEEVLKTQIPRFGEEAIGTLATMEHLNDAYLTEGRITEAVDLGNKVLEVRRRVSGDESDGTLIAMQTLARSYHSQGRVTEAADLQTEVVEKNIKGRGQLHPGTLTNQFNLAIYLLMQGRLAEALQLHEEVLQKRRRKVLGEAHAYTVQSMEAVARLYREVDRIVEAEALAAEIVEVKQKLSRDQLDYLVRTGWS
jgi:tetratricopeptide (TPR) repeat protein